MKTLTKNTIQLLYFLALATPAFAGNFEDGVAAAARNDYVAALTLWTPLAESGDKRAQHNLGVMNQMGLGVTQNYQKALHWYRQAAEQNYPDSQNNIGVFYDKGLGVASDLGTWRRK